MHHSGNKPKNRKRFLAGLAAGLLVLSILFSAAFIIKEASHDCCGEECPVCAEIAQCTQLIRSLGAGIPSVLAAVVIVTCPVMAAAAFCFFLSVKTPVFWKVRLNH